MASVFKITKIEIVKIEYGLENVEPDPTIGIPIYKPGAVMKRTGDIVRIHTNEGLIGEYTGGPSIEYSGIPITSAICPPNPSII